MKWSALALGFLISTTALNPAWPGEPCCHDNQPVATAGDAAAAFERLKKLAGEWELVKPREEAQKGKTVVSYHLLGRGSALAETLFADTPLEMLSVYHRDGDQLVMTHYCAAGNQPRMRARAGKDSKEIVFEFTGGSNLNPDKDPHIHGGWIRFIDADHVQSEWDFYTDGKLVGKHAFDLVRKKK